MKFYLIISLIIATLMFSCGEGASENKGDNKADLTLKYMDSLVVKDKVYALLDADTSLFEYSYTYMIFKGNGDVGKKIDRVCYDILADNTLNTELDSNAYKASAEELKVDFLNTAFTTPEFHDNWKIDAAMTLAINKQNVLGVEFKKETQISESRKTTQHLYMNFKIEDGSVIRLHDVIPEAHFEEFQRIGESTFRKRYNIEQSMGWEHTPFAMFADGFKLNDNFLIIETGLLFVFNPFDAALIEDRHFEMIIPWKDIEHLISEDNIVKNFISKT